MYEAPYERGRPGSSARGADSKRGTMAKSPNFNQSVRALKNANLKSVL